MSNNEEARFAVTPSFVLTHSSDSNWILIILQRNALLERNA